jgi:hypothetical protein
MSGRGRGRPRKQRKSRNTRVVRLEKKNVVLTEEEYRKAQERTRNYDSVKSNVFKDTNMIITEKEAKKGRQRDKKMSFDDANHVLLTKTEIERGKKRKGGD